MPLQDDEETYIEYIQLVIQWQFSPKVQPQMDNFLAGFNKLVPLNLFNPNDGQDPGYKIMTQCQVVDMLTLNLASNAGDFKV